MILKCFLGMVCHISWVLAGVGIGVHGTEGVILCEALFGAFAFYLAVKA